MSKQKPRGALIGGLILILLGVLFFMNNWLPGWSLGGLISKYWPVIFIAIGLRSLYLYFTYTPRPMNPPPGPKSSSEAGWAGTNVPPPS